MIEDITNQTALPEATSQPQLQIDQFELENYLRKLKAGQNLGLGLIGGLIGMVIGAVLWAVITIITDYQIGWMAIGGGFLAGGGVRFLGRGFETIFGIIGGGLALIGCVSGNLMAVTVIAARELGLPIAQLVLSLDLQVVAKLIGVTFNSIDLLFYALAVYAGYRYAFRRISKTELSKLARERAPFSP